VAAAALRPGAGETGSAPRVIVASSAGGVER